MSIDEITKALLDIPTGVQILIRKSKANPMHTHTIILMNDDNVAIKRVLYDDRKKEVFKETERDQQFKKSFKWNMVGAESLLAMHRDEMIRLVNGGLRWTIENHGVITKDSIVSASKRITCLLFNFLGTRVSFEKNGRLREYSDAQQYMEYEQSVELDH
jgi:hypothetical protein